MSYQFEDDSALEELLNQQLDRRKQQTPANGKQNKDSNRPTTGLGVKQTNTPSAFPSSLRPSTASSSLLHRLPTTAVLEAAGESASSLPPAAQGNTGASAKGKSLSSWLQGGSKASGRLRRDEVKVTKSSLVQRQHDDDYDDDGDELAAAAAAANMRNEMPGATFAGDVNAATVRGPPDTVAAADDDDEANSLDGLLSPGSLQEMSKQRLIQIILEQIVPRLNNLKALASRESAREVDRLKRELQLERNRMEVIEMRQEEQIKLERQKWQQVNHQLESRLASGELQMSELVQSQRDHLSKLDEQYQSQLKKLTQVFDQRLHEEKMRFEEILTSREQMHKLELESKLNVNCDFVKLDSLQAEWKRMLESTINQLNGQYKTVETLLDKQAIQVNGTNSDLAKKTQTLCDQYDKYEQCNERLANLTNEMSQLMPGIAQVQMKGESAMEKANEKLVKLDAKLDNLASSEKLLEQTRLELTETNNKMNEDKFKLALDSSRLSMKEERLDELLKHNSENELRLSIERKTLDELQTQAHLKRLALDERFADLKEQNYALHLLRKRLTAQREELLKAQIEFGEEKKLYESNRSQMDDESKRLDTLRVRVQRELDQLRRLQQSLVCSLCMSRLFDGTDTTNNNYQQLLASGQQQFQPASEIQIRQLDLQQLPEEIQLNNSTLGRLGVTLTRVDKEQKAPLSVLNKERADHNHDNGPHIDLDRQQKYTELERGRLEVESRYVEQLFGAELTS